MKKAIAFLMVLALVGVVPRLARAEVALDAEGRAALAALPRIDGAALTPEDLAGQVVVVAFFASWCPPCDPEFDHLKHIDQVYRERGVAVVAVDIFEQFLKDPGGRRLGAFLSGKAAAFHIVGAGERVAGRFGAVDRIPTVLVFGRDGQRVLHFIHARGATKTHATFEELAAAVEAAL